MKARPIIILPDGKTARVPLGRSGNDHAEIALHDYQELIALGLSANWSATKGYVQCRALAVDYGHSRGVPLVARVLLGAKPGQTVRYSDGNPKNLRRENLTLVDKGYSVTDPRGLLEAA